MGIGRSLRLTFLVVDGHARSAIEGRCQHLNAWPRATANEGGGGGLPRRNFGADTAGSARVRGSR